MTRIRIADQEIIDTAHPTLQNRLRHVRVSGGSLACMCNTPHQKPLFIHEKNSQLWVRKKPNTGQQHAWGCRFADYTAEDHHQRNLAKGVVVVHNDGCIQVKAISLLTLPHVKSSGDAAAIDDNLDEETDDDHVDAQQSRSTAGDRRPRTSLGLADLAMLLRGQLPNKLSDFWQGLLSAASDIKVKDMADGELSKHLVVPPVVNERITHNNGIVRSANGEGLRVLAAFSLTYADLVRRRFEDELVFSGLGAFDIRLRSVALESALEAVSPKVLNHLKANENDRVALLCRGRVCNTGIKIAVKKNNAVILAVLPGHQSAVVSFSKNELAFRQELLRFNLDQNWLAKQLALPMGELLRIINVLISKGALGARWFNRGAAYSQVRSVGATDPSVLTDEILKRGPRTFLRLAAHLGWDLGRVRRTAEELVRSHGASRDLFGPDASGL